MATLNPDHRRALKALLHHGGEGAIDRNGCLLAGGVTLGQYHGEHLVSAFHSATWLRLVSLGMVERASDMRLRLTGAGREAAK